MNRIDGYCIVNGMEVSDLVHVKACAQNVALLRRRLKLLNGTFVRRWNVLRHNDNRTAAHCAARFDNVMNYRGLETMPKSAKGNAPGYDYAYRVRRISWLEDVDTGARIEYDVDKPPIYTLSYVTVQDGKLVYCRVANAELPELVQQFLAKL